MKVLAKNLQKALKRVEKVIEPKKTMPILRHVRIRLEGQHLSFEATDLESYLLSPIPVEDAGPLDVAAPFDELKAALVVATDATGIVPIVPVEGGLRVGPVTMRTLPADEFPAVPSEVCVELGDAPAVPLLDALKAVLPAACVEESRYTIRSVCWDVRGGTFAATDGHRLHVITAPIQVADWYRESLVPGAAMELLVSPKAVQAFLTCLGKEVARFALNIERTVLRVTGPDYTLFLRPMSATYPNWRQVIPQDGQLVTLDRKALLDAGIRSLKVYRSSWSTIPGLVLTENGGTLDVVLDRGSDQMPVPCGRIPVLGDPLVKDAFLSVNARYLVDALTPMRAPVVRMQYRDRLGPVRLWCDGEPFQAVVMPLRNDGRGFRILEDLSLEVIQPPAPPKAEAAQEELEDEPEGTETDAGDEPEDLVEGEPANEDTADAPTPLPGEERTASSEAHVMPQEASADAPIR